MVALRRAAVATGFTLALVILGLVWATPSAPPCSSAGEPGDAARSAGCFTMRDQSVLVVADYNGKVALPGGRAKAGESPRCNAERESWEETGLVLTATRELARTDTGFVLFECEPRYPNQAIAPERRFEVSDVFWLPADAINQHTWRFPAKLPLLRQLLAQAAHTDSPVQ